MGSRQMIISIGREYGSGGHEIAELVAEQLNLPLLDRDLIAKVADDSEMSRSLVFSYDEKPVGLFTARSLGDTPSLEVQIAQKTFAYLEKLAAEQSFVVVGRCANELLKSNCALFSVFIRGDLKEKKERIMERRNLSEAEALRQMKKMDRARRSYHNYYSDGKWGDSREYDLCLNSSKLGVEGSAQIIVEAVKRRFERE